MRHDDTAILAAVQDRSYDEAGPGIRQSYPKAQAMDKAGMEEFLHGRKYAVLATSRPDGRPHAAPVAYTLWDGAFWIGSVRSARVGNLRARPYASIVIMEGEGPGHRVVIGEGPVRLHGPDVTQLPRGLLDLWRTRHGGEPTWAMALIEVRPTRLFSYDARKEVHD